MNRPTEENRLLRMKDVEDMIGFKKDFIFERLKNGDFPKPIKFGRVNRWKLSDIQAWIAKQV